MRVPCTTSALMAAVSCLMVAGRLVGDEPDRAAPVPTKQSGFETLWWNPWPMLVGKKNDNKGLPKAKTEKEKQAAARADKAVGPEAKSLLGNDVDPERTREQKTLFRRLDVCDQLKIIATQTRDDALMRRAEELDTRTWDIYMHNVANLPAGKAATGTADLDLGTVTRPKERPADSSREGKSRAERK